ncbi:MAG: glutamate formimidoyltransferase [Prevotella sp.]|nr:glutamate formimidoyltransferase [Prevotella sp.]
MEQRIIECVPNFSEGRDMDVVKQITDAIESVAGINLLHVDPGYATNRTVVTFTGSPEAVCEAAFQGAKKAGEVIDMRQHHGTHPRLGATDVLPLIPVSGITLEECALLARQLAQRLATEAGIPCYCYEAAALRPQFSNLAVCRAGEYEALAEKLADPEKRPDFMPPASDSSHILRTGCTTVGARDFLIAVNWNLNTTDTAVAKAIACDVREKGRPGQPGSLRCTKAIGWYIEEYGIAQVSMNITNINVTPLHVAYEEVCRRAMLRGYRVTGTEIIGLVPKRSLLEAGRYFVKKIGNEPRKCSEAFLIRAAIEGMGLDNLKPFLPEQKMIG